MREMRRYSARTIALAARRVRRAMYHITHKELTVRDQLDMLVCQLIRQGLEPIDIAKPNGFDALVVIASALPTPASTGGLEPNRRPGWIIVDSYVSEMKIAPGKYVSLPTPIRMIATKEPSATWQRVIDRVLRMPSP